MSNFVAFSKQRFNQIQSYINENPDIIREANGMLYTDFLKLVDDILRVKEANIG